MENLFLHLVNMSITAGWLVLAVMVLRLVFHRAPKWIHCLLWVLVAVRLLCPFNFESVLSLIPSAETVPVDTFLEQVPSIHSGVPAVDAVVNPIISNGLAPQPENSVNPMQVITAVAAQVWLLGVAVMLLYMVMTTLRLRWQVREAAHVRDFIWQCDAISTPFILGFFRPRIYLPTLLGAEEAKSVIAHEQAHLKRHDHWWKPLGFVLLTIYWFHPLMWVGYILLCRDIEAACDQRVVRDMDVESRREYSRVLLSCSAPKRMITACPLAFGETGVKSRIKAVLNYKKPAFWLIVAALVALAVAAVCLLTNPKTVVSDEMDAYLSHVILEQNRSEHTDGAYATEAHTVFGVDKRGGKTVVYGMVLYEEYYLDESGDLQVQSGSHCPTVITVDMEGSAYSMVEYWTPRDGADYASDIREKYPARHRGKALDTDGYYSTHHQKTLAKAKEHFQWWQTAITQAILANNRIESGSNIYACESHRIYGTTENEDVVTVYALVYYHEYMWEKNALVERSGSLGPAAITFRKNVDAYDLVQYWTPGKNWGEDIRQKFPEHLSEAAADYTRYPTEAMKQECLAKAYAYFGVKEDAGIAFRAPQSISDMNWLSQEKQEELYRDLPVDLNPQWLPILRFTSRSDLDAFIEKYRDDFDMDRAEGDGLTPIHQLSFYDNDYFADNELLAVYYKDGSCSVKPQVVELVPGTDGITLTAHVDVYEPYCQDQALGQWFLFVEVARADLEGITNLQAVVRKHIPTDTYAAAFRDAVSDPADGVELWRSRLSDEDQEYLRRMLDSAQWMEAALVDVVAVRYQWAFNFAGDYYVSEDYSMLYDGTRYYNTTAEDRAFFADLYLPGATDDAIDPNAFTGRVTRVTENGAMMLMECYETDKFREVWVSLDRIPDLSPRVGDEYVVTHTGLVEVTYPPQVTAVTAVPVSSAPKADE